MREFKRKLSSAKTANHDFIKTSRSQDVGIKTANRKKPLRRMQSKVDNIVLFWERG
jgi:hypothetical protein